MKTDIVIMVLAASLHICRELFFASRSSPDTRHVSGIMKPRQEFDVHILVVCKFQGFENVSPSATITAQKITLILPMQHYRIHTRRHPIGIAAIVEGCSIK